MIQTSRRSFLGSLLAAPVIVRVASIMPVKAPALEFTEGDLLRMIREMTEQGEKLSRLNPTKLIVSQMNAELAESLLLRGIDVSR